MAKEIKYGVISDVHKDPRIVPLAIDVLKSRGVEKLLVNGDIGNQQKTLQDSQNYVAFILDSIGKSGLESFVQPGSHETLLAFGPVIDHFENQYSNLIDVTKNQKIEQDGHHLVFLPGSDFLAGGEYQIGNNQIPSGRYIQTEEELLKFEDFSQYVSAIQQGLSEGVMQYSNIGDLRKLITNPDKTVIVCHVPRKFDNLETCVDVAHFWEGRVYHRDPKDMNQYTFTELSVLPGTMSKKEVEKFDNSRVYEIDESSEKKILEDTIRTMKKEDADRWQIFVEQKENRGNEDLKSLYEELGINKAVSGHFHESGHRANDGQSYPIKEGELVRELFWNSGYLDVGETGILTVNGNQVSYQNIRLQDYINQ